MSFMNALRFGLKETTIQKLCGVFAKYPQVTKAVLYGSRAKGNYKNGSDIDHLTFSVRPANASFYRDLLTFLGWRLMYDSPDTFGMTNGGALSLHFGPNTKEIANDYDAPGLNHIGIRTATLADVDAAASYLTERGVELLFETPRHRPDFAGSDDQTYYQIMFETPDRILVEIVYMGPK